MGTLTKLCICVLGMALEVSLAVVKCIMVQGYLYHRATVQVSRGPLNVVMGNGFIIHDHLCVEVHVSDEIEEARHDELYRVPLVCFGAEVGDILPSMGLVKHKSLRRCPFVILVRCDMPSAHRVRSHLEALLAIVHGVRSHAQLPIAGFGGRG